MKKITFLSILFIASVSLFAAPPKWYQNQSVVYPSEFYITAVGEGADREEAEIKAISTISMYFQTTAEVTNDLLKKYNEYEKGDVYSIRKSTSVREKSKITSNAEFLGVQFAEGFVVDGVFTTLAYIDREIAYGVYDQRIQNNSAILASLLPVAEDYDNPIYGYEAAKMGLPVADLNTQLLKMARLVKKVNDNHYSYDNSLIERMYAAYETSKNNRVFYLDIDNDYNGMIKRTISDLLESKGYDLSDRNGVCRIPVEITVSEEKTETALFLYCGIVVNVTTGRGDVIFSYSRNFPKKGGKTKDMAYKRAFQEIQKELNATFADEFGSKIKAE